MTLETAFFDAGLPNLFGPEYDRFAAKWDAVRLSFGPNHWYWSGERQEWECYDPEHFTVTDVGLEAVGEKRDQAAIWIFRPVEESWARVRNEQPDAIWNPRNGGWFIWMRRPSPSPPPIPPPIPPIPPELWTQRMNEELAAVDRLNLSPAEREEARAAVRRRYLGS
jgi:hypothetical protein